MKKTNLESYLNYYLSLNAPGFAVLVTGEWGSGKTHQVLKAIPANLQCHVSLFGIDNSQEVYSTVFSKMYPGKNFAKKILDMTKEVSSEVGGVTFGAGSIISNMLGPLIKQTVDKEKVLIFDDLERCTIPNNDILGVINQYVEHHQCKVIILAHDIKTHHEFIKTKEKIVGHTIKIEPQIDEAAESFFSENQNLNNYLQAKSLILEAFKKSNCHSLRILKCVINDCSRLLKCLEPAHIKNTLAMQNLFNYFCLLNIEFRLGNLNANEIRILPKNQLEYITFKSKSEKASEDEKKKNENILKFIDKYSMEEIRNPSLNNELLGYIFDSGRYPAREITDSINLSKYFFQRIKHPAWVKIINFDSLESEIVRAAIEEMFDDFKYFRVTDIEDMMHCFCLTYMLSEIHEINMGFEEIYLFQCKYIDNLLEKELLQPEPLVYNPFADSIYTRAKSYSYWIKDTYQKYISDLIFYLKKSRKSSQINKRPEYAKEILCALDNDIEHFKFLLLGDGIQSGKYSTIDILSQISPEEFVIHWLTLPIENWDRISSILLSRHSNVSTHQMLYSEKLWLCEINLYLFFEAKMNRGIDRARIERLFPYRALAKI